VIIVLKTLGVLLLLLALYQAVRMRVLIQRGKKLARSTVAFQRLLPGARMRILIAGDSTAVGTGAARPEESVAGLFGRDNPDAEIVNVSGNGKRVGELLNELAVKVRPFHRQGRTLDALTFQLIVLQIGANDIVYLTPLSQLRSDLNALLIRARELSPTVLVLHSGNIGAAPLFPWPLSAFYTARTREVRSLYQELAAQNDAHYVDLFRERGADVFLRDPVQYYASDLYHPSSAGYALWYRRIREVLDKLEQ